MCFLSILQSVKNTGYMPINAKFDSFAVNVLRQFGITPCDFMGQSFVVFGYGRDWIKPEHLNIH